MVGLSGKVLLLGGSGFLGRAIMKVAADEGWDAEFTVFSRDEYKQDLCRRRFGWARYVLGDVQDVYRLEGVMHGHDVVVHAAALKYIPEAERNVAEALRVNLDGSRAVVVAAVAAQVPCVVGVSTDKAVNPTNVYGATKMLMERVFIEAQGGWAETRFSLVRYGNVIASTGSVIPLLLRQAAEGSEVTITDPHMTRFWITYQEAVHLICAAAAPDAAGEIVFPETAAMRMDDLAQAIGVVADLPHYSTWIKVVGARPGEKQHEAMMTWEESVRTWQDGGSGFYHIGALATRDEGWVATSNNPQRWWDIDSMRRAIVDAVGV